MTAPEWLQRDADLIAQAEMTERVHRLTTVLVAARAFLSLFEHMGCDCEFHDGYEALKRAVEEAER